MQYKDMETDTVYMVMGGFGKHRDHYRVMSSCNGHLHVVKDFSWRASEQEAQTELDALAKENGWKIW